jgi:energy-coupling factor transporter ATP-binding protein EcfA2
MTDVDPENFIFINRDEEIRLVLNRVSELTDGKPYAPKERVFHFVGPSGIGKSSLLKRIRFLLNKAQGIAPILLRLDALQGRGQEFVDEVLKTVYDEFCKHQEIKSNPILGKPLKSRQEYASMIVRAISLRKDIVPVVLLDEVNVPSQEDMQEIEERLLEKFLHGNNLAVLITAGRSQPSFSDFALRPNSSNIFPLSAFDEEKTGQQLERLKPGSGQLANKVVKLGRGVPGNTVKLVDHVSGDPPDIPNGLQAIQSLLADIKENNRIEGRYYPMLEALSILQGFFPEDVVPLFQCHPQLGAGWDEGRVRRVFTELQQIRIGPGGVVEWDREKKHWAMDESTRDLFERELQMRNPPELWRKLHCTALEMYRDWGEKFNSDVFRKKSDYHQQRLRLAGMTCE